jgi:predicted RNA-binding Zn-ribbon protein involved in translation (DUF1610 family)
MTKRTVTKTVPKICAECGADFIGTHDRRNRFCSPNCGWRWTNKHRDHGRPNPVWTFGLPSTGQTIADHAGTAGTEVGQ